MWLEGSGDVEVGPDAKRAHLRAFVEQRLGGRPVVLVGASVGGAIAMDFALRYPEVRGVLNKHACCGGNRNRPTSVPSIWTTCSHTLDRRTLVNGHASGSHTTTVDVDIHPEVHTGI